MDELHTLGKVEVKAGELITFTYDDPSPAQRKRISVTALADINLSEAMADFYQSVNRKTNAIYTENALPAFIEYLCEKRLLHVGAEVSVHLGVVGRPAMRMSAEQRFKINPESFWEEKLVHHYKTRSFHVTNHEDHLLTLLWGVDAPFAILADIITMDGRHLGILHLSVLSNKPRPTISEEDIEVIRIGLQADITLHIGELSVLVERITLLNNPDFAVNPFSKHSKPPFKHTSEKQKEHLT